MEDCELCGNPVSSVSVVKIEDVELRVCQECAKGKRAIYREEPKRAQKGMAALQKKAAPKNEESEIIEGYGAAIRKAREAMKLPIKVLAEMINEKESLLLRVEQERTKPSVGLAKRLEKALNIKLEQEADSAESKGHFSGSRKSATLGEFVE